jgi:hypothetical protein
MPIQASPEKRLEWQELIQKQQVSGLSIQKWCSQNQIKFHQFCYWKEKLFPKQLQKSSFTELSMKRPDAISLQARGIYIRMGNDCDPHLRKQLFALFTSC